MSYLYSLNKPVIISDSNHLNLNNEFDGLILVFSILFLI